MKSPEDFTGRTWLTATSDPVVTAGAEETAAVAGRRFRWREVLLGLAVTLFFSILLYLRMDFSAFSSSLAKVNYALLAPMLVLHALAWWVRGVRWRVLLSPVSDPGTATLFRFAIIGAMISALVPARAGDFWRAHSLGRREGLSRSTVFGTIVVERVLDGLVLVLLASIAALAIGSPASLTVLIGSMVLLVTLGLGLLAVLAFSERARLTAIRTVVAVIPVRYRAFVEDKLGLFMDGLSALRQGRVLSGAIVLTVVTLMIEAAAYWSLGVAFGLGMNPQSFILVVAVAHLAMAIPISIGGIGPFEFFVQQSLVALGVSSSLGLAYAAYLHGLMFAFVVVMGLVFLWSSVGSFSPRRWLQPTLASQTRADHSTLQAD